MAMKTIQLHDIGEERWPIRVHCGCGGTYLIGYKNVDANGIVADVVPSSNVTEISEYYRDEATWDSLPKRRKAYCDIASDIRELDSLWKDGEVDKIVAFQVLEHLSPLEAQMTIDQFHSLLRPGGVLIVSVPDMEETLNNIETCDPEMVAFSVRHLRGTRKDQWSYHKSWWTEETLGLAFRWVGFRTIGALDNFHAYPSVVMKGIK